MGAILLSTQAMAAITPKSDTPDGHKKRNSKNARLPNKVVSNKTDIASTDEELLTVSGHGFNTMHQSVGLSRMPQDVMHTPQNINVVPQALMRQQNVKSLDEALRNVPGVTASIGEGAGGMNGDQFLIRGFQAQNDIYEDGPLITETESKLKESRE